MYTLQSTLKAGGNASHSNRSAGESTASDSTKLLEALVATAGPPFGGMAHRMVRTRTLAGAEVHCQGSRMGQIIIVLNLK